MIKIGIDGRSLQGKLTGVGRYVTELCRSINNKLPDALFFVYSNLPVTMPLQSDRWILRLENNILYRKIKPTLWLKMRCGHMCRKDRIDTFWATATLFPRLDRKTMAITTVYDLTYKVIPNTMGMTHRIGHQLFFSKDVLRADRVVAISNGTSDRLFTALGRTADAIVYPAIGREFYPRRASEINASLNKYGIRKPYILCVATLEPRKNIALLARVFSELRNDHNYSSLNLVLAGTQGWGDSNIGINPGDKKNIICTGFVHQDDLPSLYCGAEVFAFPSLYEGFGMPVLEARACGTTVVTTDSPETREAGADGAFYVQPTFNGIYNGLINALQHKKVRDKIDTPLFDWNRGAEIMAGLLTARR